MASPQKENGFTPIANELLEAFCRLHLSGNEWAYLHALLRKTYGYNKKEDWVTNSQIMQMTGLRKERVSEAKRGLISKNIVTENRNKVSLQKDYEKWLELRKTVTVVTENRNKSYGNPYTQKTKDNTQKTISDKSQIMKKNKLGKYNENSHDDFEDSIDIESGEYIEEEPKPKRTYPIVYAIFREVTGKDNPLNWKVNKTQQTAAENLLKEHSEEHIRQALKFVKTHQGQEYCPTVDSPYDLDSKWAKIKKFKDSL